MRDTRKTTILLERRTILLDEEPNGFVLCLDTHPSPDACANLSREEVRSLAHAMLKAIGDV